MDDRAKTVLGPRPRGGSPTWLTPDTLTHLGAQIQKGSIVYISPS